MSAPAILPPHIAEACSRALRNWRTGYADNRGEKPFREGLETFLQ
jgi:aspartate/methionine/tyrosine aminotransferase